MKQSNIKWIVVLTLCCVVFISPLYAQQFDTILRSRLKATHMNFKMPKGFKERDSITLHDCGDGKFPRSSLIYSITNKDSTIIIGFFNILEASTTHAKNAVNNALSIKNSFGDTINFTSTVYNAHYSEQKFNAHVAGEYTRPCPIVFLKEYTNNRIVFLANNKWGQGYIIYYCKDSAREEWLKLIKEGPAILKFNKL